MTFRGREVRRNSFNFCFMRVGSFEIFLGLRRERRMVVVS